MSFYLVATIDKKDLEVLLAQSILSIQVRNTLGCISVLTLKMKIVSYFS